MKIHKDDLAKVFQAMMEIILKVDCHETESFGSHVYSIEGMEKCAKMLAEMAEAMS